MDPLTVSIIANIATNYFTSFTAPTVEKFFRYVFKQKPELESRLKEAKTTRDIESIFNKAIGVVDANAGSGEIDIDGSFLEAVRGVRFDHAHGQVTIAGSTIAASVLVTGGGQGSTGETTISGSELKSKGTSMKVGKNAKVKIRGDAKIKQT